LARVKKEIRACAEKEAVDLALAVAKKIVCQEISANNQIVLNVVKEALKKVEYKEEIIIKINPVDLKVIEKCRADTPALFKDIGNVVFKGDPSLSNGGCVIETKLGVVDARIERQLMAVEEAFRSELSAIPAAG
jgi:flagellar biosynthesis/type III secretory pathway protein FliH